MLNFLLEIHCFIEFSIKALELRSRKHIQRLHELAGKDPVQKRVILVGDSWFERYTGWDSLADRVDVCAVGMFHL